MIYLARLTAVRWFAMVLVLASAAALAPSHSGTAYAAPVTFTVTTTADPATCPAPPSTDGSLRCAINAANADASGNPVVIQFNLAIASASGCYASLNTCFIFPQQATPLTISRDNVTVDGYSQPGSSPNTSAQGSNAKLVIDLIGSSAPTGAHTGLILTGASDAVQGLSFTQWLGPAPGYDGIGLQTSGANDSVTGSFIGITPYGAGGGNNAGILSLSTAQIGGTAPPARNVMDGNGIAMHLAGTGHYTVQGNLVGLNPAGTAAVANNYGIYLESSDPAKPSDSNTIGPGNVISGNYQDGMQVCNTQNSVVVGNLIGTDVTGTVALGNQGNGMWVLPVCSGTTGTAKNIRVGGTTPADRNVISGNGILHSDNTITVGVYFLGNGTGSFAGSQIEGNYIGTDISGNVKLPNQAGIILGSADNMTVGGPHISSGCDGPCNLVSGNNYNGIGIGFVLGNNYPDHNVNVQGNLIGPALNGARLFAQSDGITVGSASSSISIGGDAAGAGNTISGNYGPAIRLGRTNTDNTHIAMLHNRMYNNGGGSISFWDRPPNQCTTPGAAGAPNDGMSCPTITSVSSTLISGTDPGCANCRIDAYLASNGVLDGQYGGALQWLGQTTTAADGTWTVTVPAGSYDGKQPVTATATQQVPGSSPAQYETSELSRDAIPASTSFAVTGTGDTGSIIPCQDAGGQFPANPGLRCIISLANLVSNKTVTFAIPPTDPNCAGSTPAVCTFSPTSSMPSITGDKITVDGYSQAGAHPNSNPVGQADNAVLTMQLDGKLAGYSHGIVLGGVGDVVQGLSIGNFKSAGVYAGGSDSLVSGNFLGIKADGHTPAPNGYAGAEVGSGPSTIGGMDPAARNVISGNKTGVYTYDKQVTVRGNYIGTDATGTQAVPNTTNGVWLDGAYNSIIGGTDHAAANLISGNAGPGVAMDYANGDTVLGNLIGTNAAGDAALPNTRGVVMSPSGTSVRQPGGATNPSGPSTSTVTVAGASSAFHTRAVTGALPVAASSVPPSSTVVSQPADSGTPARSVSSGNTIGGTATGAGNVIAGNTGDGIELLGVSTGNAIQGNRIGVTSTGAPLANTGRGIFVHGASSPAQVGGSTPGAGNIIAHNGATGIQIGDAATDHSQLAINQNSIFANTGKGIDLFAQTPCTAGPTATAPNDYTPCPKVVQPVTPATVTGTACQGCTVEVFVADAGGQGQTYLGSTTAGTACATPPCGGDFPWTLAASGTCTTTCTYPSGATFTQGQTVTATATQPGSTPETSAFANTTSPTAATVTRFTATRSSSGVLFRWHVSRHSGLLGFHLLAGRLRLDHRLIVVHRSAAYRSLVHTTRHGPYRLQVVLQGGHTLLLTAP